MSEMDTLISEVRSLLTSHGAYSSRNAWLDADVSASSSSLSLDTGSGLGEGVVEIDDEALYVRSWDGTSNNALIAPDGRGWDGSTAAAHSAGTRVIVEPTHPRSTIRKAITQAVNRLWPRVWAVGEHVLMADAASAEYTLPADVESILRIDASGWQGDWCEVRRYSFVPDGPTGPTLRLGGGVIAGNEVRVVYNRRVDPAVLSTSDWADLGLSDSARSAVIFAATAHLMRFTETGRLTSVAASSDSFEGARPFYVTGIKIATDLEQQYQLAVAEEQQRLRQTYPPRIVRTS